MRNKDDLPHRQEDDHRTIGTKACHNAENDEDWIRTVLQGLGQRSDEVKQALMKAMVDGQPSPSSEPVTNVGHASGLEQQDIESSQPRPSKQITDPTPHVSGTTSLSFSMAKVDLGPGRS